MGKTTALLQFLRQKSDEGMKCLHISADSVLLSDMRLVDIVESFVAEGGDVLSIDEIHRKESWGQELKTIHDSFPGLKLIASGSSSMQLGKADLSRRAIKVNCYGLSFREWLNISYNLSLGSYSIAEILKSHPDIAQSIIASLSERKISINESFSEYLRTGYFPTSFDLDDWVYFETVNESIRKTIEDDILSCYPQLTGKSLQRIKKTLAIIAEKCPYVPDINDLTKALDIADQKTTKQYLYYLHESLVIREIAKQGKTISALSKPEKIYLDNTSYLYALSKQEPNIGTVRETFLANMLSVYYEMHKQGEVQIPKKGDFLSPDEQVFEVGGKSKGLAQIAGQANSWVAADLIEFGEGRKIPLWIFGFCW